jgi:ribosomal-protein-alanine N-acetyltransferase
MLTHKGTETIETERLILRRYELSDAEAIFYHWTSDEIIVWEPHKTVEQTENELINWAKDYNRIDFYEWGIELKETGQIIGAIAVIECKDNLLCGELVYNMSRYYRGQGIMTETVKAVISFLFSEVGLNRIEARHDVDNPASGRVMEKAGMKFEGILRQNCLRKDGSFGDLIVF